jgi:hypothetical protein
MALALEDKPIAPWSLLPIHEDNVAKAFFRASTIVVLLGMVTRSTSGKIHGSTAAAYVN